MATYSKVGTLTLADNVDLESQRLVRYWLVFLLLPLLKNKPLDFSLGVPDGVEYLIRFNSYYYRTEFTSDRLPSSLNLLSNIIRKLKSLLTIDQQRSTVNK